MKRIITTGAAVITAALSFAPLAQAKPVPVLHRYWTPGLYVFHLQEHNVPATVKLNRAKLNRKEITNTIGDATVRTWAQHFNWFPFGIHLVTLQGADWSLGRWTVMSTEVYQHGSPSSTLYRAQRGRELVTFNVAP